MSLTTISITKKGDRSITVIYHAISLTALSVSLGVIDLSEWFMVCLWLYCISITKKSDRSITVIYHGMSLTTISITKNGDRSITVIYHAMSLTTSSVSLRRVICLSQWCIMLCLWLNCISITKKSNVSISDLSYHAMSDCTVSLRRVINLSQWFITLCLWLLYQYH